MTRLEESEISDLLRRVLAWQTDDTPIFGMGIEEVCEVLELLLIAALHPDDPELDATDGAHPAWFRGEEHATKRVVGRLQKAIDGDDDGAGGISYAPLEKLRRDILALKANAARAEAAEKIAIWAHDQQAHADWCRDPDACRKGAYHCDGPLLVEQWSNARDGTSEPVPPEAEAE